MFCLVQHQHCNSKNMVHALPDWCLLCSKYLHKTVTMLEDKEMVASVEISTKQNDTYIEYGSHGARSVWNLNGTMFYLLMLSDISAYDEIPQGLSPPYWFASLIPRHAGGRGEKAPGICSLCMHFITTEFYVFVRVRTYTGDVIKSLCCVPVAFW